MVALERSAPIILRKELLRKVKRRGIHDIGSGQKPARQAWFGRVQPVAQCRLRGLGQLGIDEIVNRRHERTGFPELGPKGLARAEYSRGLPPA